MRHLGHNHYISTPRWGALHAAYRTGRRKQSVFGKFLRLVQSCYADKYDILTFDTVIVGSDILVNLILAKKLVNQGKSCLIVDDFDRGYKRESALLSSARMCFFDKNLLGLLNPDGNVTLSVNFLNDAIKGLIKEITSFQSKVQTPSVLCLRGSTLTPDAGISRGFNHQQLLWPEPISPYPYYVLDQHKLLRAFCTHQLPRLTVDSTQLTALVAKHLVKTSCHPNFSDKRTYDCPVTNLASAKTKLSMEQSIDRQLRYDDINQVMNL